MTADEALIQHLNRQKVRRYDVKGDVDAATAATAAETDTESVNCLVFWARPPATILSLIDSLQQRVSGLVGSDLHLIPLSDLHLSVIELSHRHSVAHLHSVVEQVGRSRIQTMLDLVCGLPSDIHDDQRKSQPCPRLVAPRLVIDKMGVALSFLPHSDDNNEEQSGKIDANSSVQDTDKSWTYHHLRSTMHSIALESGIGIDHCYTAPTAHVTIGRFVNDSYFHSPDATMKFVELIREINAELLRSWPSHLASWLGVHGMTGAMSADGIDGADTSEIDWYVGQEKSLELQLGYLKFGRKRELALMTGRHSGPS